MLETAACLLNRAGSHHHPWNVLSHCMQGQSRWSILPLHVPSHLLPASPPVHAAVLAINEAVDRGVVAQTMETLHNPHAMLMGLREELAGAYQEVLHQAKLEKGSNARNRVRRA